MEKIRMAEFYILDFIQNLRCEFLDSLMRGISSLANAGVIWIALAIVLLIFKKTRRAGMCVALALILDFILCNVIIKPIVARPRPFTFNEIVLLITAPTDFSFPSGHTAVSFAATSALFFSKSKLWIPSFIISVLIAFSRLYLYVHFPSDILAGMAVGAVCGMVAHLVLKQAYTH